MTVPGRGRIGQAATLLAHVAVLALLEYRLIAWQLPSLFPWKHLIAHDAMIVALDGAVLVAGGIVALLGSRHRRWRMLSREAVAILFAVVTVAQLVIYIGDHYVLAIMGRYADARLIGVGAAQGWHDLAAWGGAAAKAGLAVAAGAVVAASVALCRFIQARQFPPVPDGHWRLIPSSPSGWVLAVVFLGFYASGFAVVGRYAERGAWRVDDPFVALVPAAAINTTGSDEANLRERQDYRQTAPAVAPRRNIVIIVADSLRADHLGNYGYGRPTTPFLMKLQAGGHLRRVDTVTSACSESICGAFAILGSKLIAHAAGETNFMLHNVLRDRGYAINFVLSGSHSEDNPLPKFYGPMFDFAHYIDGDISGHGADDRAVVDYLKAMPASDGKPAMFFIWLMSSHDARVPFLASPPFEPTPPFAPTSLFLNEGRHDFPPDIRKEVVNTYDNGVVQTDQIIEQVFSVLGDKGYLSDSVVFITGDHGEGLGERGLYAHGRYLYGEFVRIPLLIYDTSATAYRNLSFANQTDIAPTVLDLLGLPEPRSWEGGSLKSGPPREVTFTQNDLLQEQPCRGVNLRRDGMAPYLIQCERADGTRSEEIFDLTNDPLGLHPMTEPPPALVDDMRGLLAKTFPLRRNHF